MRSLITVAKFSFKEMVTRKSFIITTLIFMALCVIGCNVPNIIEAINDGESDLSSIVILDQENIFENNLDVIKNAGLDYDITITKDSYDEIKKQVADGKYDYAAIIIRDKEFIKVKYLVDNTYTTYYPEEFNMTLNKLYSNIQLYKYNLDEEQIKNVNMEFIPEVETIEDEGTSNNLAMMIISMFLFFAIFYCAVAVSNSITTEKTSKIIETLVTSTSPKNIIIGKTIGIGLGGLLQFVLILATLIISAYSFMDHELISMVIDLSTITPLLGIITLLYFILGYGLYAVMFALTGSTVDKPEDVQNANAPVTIISMISFYAAYFGMINPTASFNNILELVPFTSPFCLPLRIMMNLTSTGEVLLSLLILIVSIILVAYISIKIYSNAILNTGNKLNIKNLVKLFKQK